MNELKELEVDEVSLVDAGANPQAHIVFFKRKQEEELMAKKDVAVEAVEKQEEVLTEVSQSNEGEKALGLALDGLQLRYEKEILQKRVAELEEQLAARDAAEKAEIDKAAAEKAAADNAELVATLERLNKRMEEHIEKAEDAELMKVAAKYEVLGENAENTFKLLKSLKGTEGYDLLIGTFDKALAQVEQSGLFDEIGKHGRNSNSSAEELAKKFQQEDSKLTWRQALEKAYSTGAM